MTSRVSAPLQEDEVWAPILLAACDASQAAMADEIAKRPGIVVRDHFSQQLDELLDVLYPNPRTRPRDRDALRIAHLGDTKLVMSGTWIFYPWLQTLVRVLPRDDYRRLRTARNHYKILPAEQERLLAARIAVAGLSVGLASVMTLALEGVGGAFHLADFDRLSLSNMNRLRAGIHEIGLRKTTIAARALFEIDPYLEVKVFAEGVTEANIDAFLGGEPGIDVLIEECDGLDMKVRLREVARANGIPVLMETSDRGMLDVERFDLEPERELFHGRAGQLSSSKLHGLTAREKAPYVLQIIDREAMSTRMASSLVEVEETIETWPQLASGVALGGALITDAARRLLLGSLRHSGRYYVDLDDLLAPDHLHAFGAQESIDLAIVNETRERRTVPALPDSADSKQAQLRWLAGFAILAPSGGNVQAWRFLAADSTIEASIDRDRGSILDWRSCASSFALGAASLNAEIAARHSGLATSTELLPSGPEGRAWRIELGGRARPDSERYEAMVSRATVRRIGPCSPLHTGRADRLVAAAAAEGGSLTLLRTRTDLHAAADVIAAGERLRALDHRLHAATMQEIRWTPEQSLRTRDGIDLATFELDDVDLAGLRLCSNWSVMQQVRTIGGGRALEDQPRRAIESAAAVGLLTVDGTGPKAFMRGGRAMQALWIAATSDHLGLQPFATLPYLFMRIAEGGSDALEPHTVNALRTLRRSYEAVLAPTGSEVMLFRVTEGANPHTRSLRRQLEDVLVTAP